MVQLQQQNPHLVPGQTQVPPDTPVPPRRRFQSSGTGSHENAHSPVAPSRHRTGTTDANSSAHREPDYDPELDHEQLHVHDGLSDHEEHEPDEDSPTEDFIASGSPDREESDGPTDIRITVPAFNRGSPQPSPKAAEKHPSHEGKGPSV